jgi:hypothetical protein
MTSNFLSSWANNAFLHNHILKVIAGDAANLQFLRYRNYNVVLDNIRNPP